MFNKKTKLKLTDFECNLLINGMKSINPIKRPHRVTDGDFAYHVRMISGFSKISSSFLMNGIISAAPPIL